MGQQHGVLLLGKALRQIGFVLVDVQPGAGDAALPQGLHQGPLVHHRSPGGVDEKGRGLHAPQLTGADEVAGVRGQRHVQRNEVRRRQQFVESGGGGAQPRFLPGRQAAAVMVQHPHTETGGPAADGLPDASQADDAQRLAADLGAQEVQRRPVFEAALAGAAVALDNPPRAGQHQGEGGVGGGVSEHIRGVAHRDAAGRGGRDINIVVAHAVVGDHLQLRGAIQQLDVDAVGDHAQKALLVRQPCQDVGTLHGVVIGVHLDIVFGGNGPDNRLGQPSADQHFHGASSRNYGARKNGPEPGFHAIDPSAAGCCRQRPATTAIARIFTVHISAAHHRRGHPTPANGETQEATPGAPFCAQCSWCENLPAENHRLTHPGLANS